MNTPEAFINWRDGKITLKVREEEVVYTLPSTIKHSIDYDDECYYAHESDLLIYDFIQEVILVDPLQE